MNEMMNKMMEQMAEQMMQAMMMQMMQNMMAQFGNTQSLAPAQVVSEQPKEEVKKDNHVNAAVACTTTSVTCKWGIEEILLDNGKKKFYRITDGIFTAGKWRQSKYDANKEYRIPTNLEAQKLAIEKIKKLDGIQSINPNGAEWKAYGFTSKKAAEAAIKKLPEKIDRAEIASYISEFGPIKGKAVTREKKTA